MNVREVLTPVKEKIQFSLFNIFVNIHSFILLDKEVWCAIKNHSTSCLCLLSRPFFCVHQCFIRSPAVAFYFSSVPLFSSWVSSRILLCSRFVPHLFMIWPFLLLLCHQLFLLLVFWIFLLFNLHIKAQQCGSTCLPLFLLWVLFFHELWQPVRMLRWFLFWNIFIFQSVFQTQHHLNKLWALVKQRWMEKYPGQH